MKNICKVNLSPTTSPKVLVTVLINHRSLRASVLAKLLTWGHRVSNKGTTTSLLTKSKPSIKSCSQTKGPSALLKFVQVCFLTMGKTWQLPRNPQPCLWRKTANWTSCRVTLQASTKWSQSQTTKKERDKLTSSMRWETLNNASWLPKTSAMVMDRAKPDKGWNSN